MLVIAIFIWQIKNINSVIARKGTTMGKVEEIGKKHEEKAMTATPSLSHWWKGRADSEYSSAT